MCVGLEENFGIGMGGLKAGTAGLEFGAQFGVVVDFTVVSNSQPWPGEEHGLMAAFQVENRQAAVAEMERVRRCFPETFPIGSAMS
jgi:hypothetical protein